jgi:SAM-dependent methyltransferase
MMKPIKTGERMVPEAYRSEADYILYLRHLFAYRTAAALLRPSDSVLDIGCGVGYGTRLLSEHAGRTVGVDVASDAVEHAVAAYGSARCTFLVHDGRRLPFDDGAFDAATSFQTIEHVADDGGFVAEAARVLKPGALFLLTTPNRTTRLREGQRPWNRFHVREYTSRELELLLSAHFTAFEVLGIRGSPAIEEIENSRLRRAQRHVLLDPLGLRHLVPATLMSLAHRLQTTPRSAAISWPHSVEDFRASAADRDAGMDLLAVCRG